MDEGANDIMKVETLKRNRFLLVGEQTPQDLEFIEMENKIKEARAKKVKPIIQPVDLVEIKKATILSSEISNNIYNQDRKLSFAESLKEKTGMKPLDAFILIMVLLFALMFGVAGKLIIDRTPKIEICK